MLVLDATCSVGRGWPAYADLRIDIDPAARPDILANASRLPLKDGVVSEVFCDPPHFVAFPGDVRWKLDFARANPRGFQRFSYWPTRAVWLTFLERSTAEFHRVLAPGGTLRYKAPDGSKSHGRMIDYREVCGQPGFELVQDRRVISDSVLTRRNRKRGRSATVVHYLALRRTPRRA